MKYLLILITWMGSTAPFTQEIPVRSESDCEGMKGRLEQDWKDAPKDFGSVMDCRKNPRFKPKGQRK